MVPVFYWCMRLVRRRIPSAVSEKMLDLGILLKPGQDTSAPKKSVEQITDICAKYDVSLNQQRVCVVGYGGSFGIAVALLDAGVSHVVLQDPYAPVRRSRIRRLGPERLQKYFTKDGKEWIPDPEFITIVSDHLDSYARQHPSSVDVVFSSSVLEHVDDVDRLLQACSTLIRPAGLNIHNIDLRDHYFRYPFEMLCYSDATWKGWLDSSNLNRWRLPDYLKSFSQWFPGHEVIPTESLPDVFGKTKHRIQPSFLTGNDEVDCITKVRVEARKAA